MITGNIALFLAFFGLFQGILLSLYLFTLKKGNKKLNFYLALILLGLSLRIGKSVLGYYTPLEAWQKNIGISGIFIVGPFLWFYGMTLFQPQRTLSYRDYIHLVPFVLFVLLFAVIPSNGEFETFWNYGLVVFHLAIYLVLSWISLIGNKSNSTSKKFSWYRNILIGVSLVWIYYLGNFLNLKLHYIWGPVFYAFLIYAFSYLFLNRDYVDLEKYGSSTLDSKSSLALFKKVQRLIIEESLFLEPTISLKNISERLAASSRKISQAINENGQQNFHEFINAHRVSKAKDLLINSEHGHKKIAAIAYDSGFNTVTAFNVAFKKNTGTTPSKYRKENLTT